MNRYLNRAMLRTVRGLEKKYYKHVSKMERKIYGGKAEKKA